MKGFLQFLILQLLSQFCTNHDKRCHGALQHSPGLTEVTKGSGSFVYFHINFWLIPCCSYKVLVVLAVLL